MVLSTTLSCYLGSALVFALLNVASSQCSPSTLMAACHGLQVATFLETDIPPSAAVTITCDPQSVSLSGWSHSPGTGVVTDLLDTSPSKYSTNGDTLTITNINRTDEGVYRCIYSNGNTPEQCIFVYGRARFKSCPNHFDRCPDTVSLSVEDGGSVSFDGITNYTRGGSCGFQQEITRVQLTKINPEFGVDDDLLLSCDVAVVTCADRRVSLSRGNDPGYEFVFTLTGATVDDSGMYKVEVGVEHPRTGSSGSIIKMFHLNVSELTPSSTSSTPQTAPSVATTTGVDDGPGVTTDTTGQPRSSPNSEAITIGVLVPVVLIIIAVAVILAIVLLIFIWRRSKYSDPPDNEKAPESRVIAQEENRGGGRGEKVVPGNQTQTGAGLDPVYTQIVTAREEQPPPYFPKSEPPINSEELNKMNNKERKVVEPTLYDNRSSLVESDFHLPADTNLNSAVELVTICEGDEAAYTSRTRY